jgi:Zn finger protein HypA/HybF involved in hydrogenase expression
MNHQIERMKAIVAQAVAEAQQHSAALSQVRLTVYGAHTYDQIENWFRAAALGTTAEKAELVIEDAGSRYICWNCCGLRFEAEDGVCPNCGEMALEVPDDIDFSLRQAVMHWHAPS